MILVVSLEVQIAVASFPGNAVAKQSDEVVGLWKVLPHFACLRCPCVGHEHWKVLLMMIVRKEEMSCQTAKSD